ncbi:MAG: GTP-binding protein [Anaerovoracaceae bacterium]
MQSYTEEIWGNLSQAGIPVIFFINKTDRAGADPERVNEELQRLSADCTVLNEESVAYRDDEFMEKYLEDDYSHDEYRRAARHAVSERRLFPVVTGAALKGEGVETLLDLMAFLKECAYDERDEIGGIVWKIEYDHRGTRWALIKLVSGTLHARDSIAREDGSVLKAGELRMQQGGKTANIKSASAGDICAVSGMESLNQGDVIGSYSKRSLKSKMPVLRSRIRTDGSVDMNRFFSYMQIMSDEISTLSAEKQGDDVIVNINGTVQLEVFPEIIKERFGIDVVLKNLK